MATAGTITWDLVANSSKFVTELEKANKAGKNWGDKLGKAAKGVATTFAAAGAAAAASLAALYTVTAGNIDEQAKFADKIGVSTDALGGLHHAADLTGVSTENMNLGLQRMTRRVAEAAQGTGTAVDALDALNLSAEDLNQLSPDEQFLAIADAMGEVEGRSEQVRLAFKLFDSGGVALLNTMDMASDGIREAMEQAENLGIALNRVDAAQVENANDAFDVMTKVSSGISRQLTVAFAPAVEAVSNKVTELALETEWVGEVGTTVFNAVVKGAGYAANYIYFVSLEVLGLRAGFMELAAIAAESMTDSAQTVTKVLNATVGNVGKLIKWIIDQLSSLVSMGEKLPGHAGEWARNVSGVLEELGKKVNEKLQFDEEGVVEGIEAIREAADDAYKDFENLANQELPSEQIEKIVEEWQSLSRAEAEAAANAKKYNDTLDGIDPSKLTVKQVEAQEQALLALQRNLGYQEQVINWSYDNQIKQIEDLVLTEKQVREAGFENIEALQEEFYNRTNAQRNRELEKLKGQNDTFSQTFYDSIKNSAQSFDSIWSSTFNRFASNFGDAVSGAIIDGKNFGDAMDQIAIGFSRSMISAFVEIATKQLVLWAMEKTILRAKTVESGVNAYSSMAATPIIGPALAPAAGALAIANTESMISGIAHRGISEIPREGTWLLDRNERVLSSEQNKDLTDYLANHKEIKEQTIYSPTIVIESGASQSDDLAFAEKIIDEVFNRLVADGKVNGPVRRSMNS